MRSLIILEVEHGETTDGLDSFIESAREWYDENDTMENGLPNFVILDYTVKVDLPECFTLDSTPSV